MPPTVAVAVPLETAKTRRPARGAVLASVHRRLRGLARRRNGTEGASPRAQGSGQRRKQARFGSTGARWPFLAEAQCNATLGLVIREFPEFMKVLGQ